MIERDPSNAFLHYRLGNAYSRQKPKRLDLARLAYDRAVALDPALADAFNAHGLLLMHLARVASDAVNHKKGTSSVSNNSRQPESGGQTSGAICATVTPPTTTREALLEEAARIFRAGYDRALKECGLRYFSTLKNLARVLRELHRFEEAIDVLESIIADDVFNAPAMWNLAD